MRKSRKAVAPSETNSRTTRNPLITNNSGHRFQRARGNHPNNLDTLIVYLPATHKTRWMWKALIGCALLQGRYPKPRRRMKRSLDWNFRAFSADLSNVATLGRGLVCWV